MSVSQASLSTKPVCDTAIFPSRSISNVVGSDWSGAVLPKSLRKNSVSGLSSETGLSLGSL